MTEGNAGGPCGQQQLAEVRCGNRSGWAGGIETSGEAQCRRTFRRVDRAKHLWLLAVLGFGLAAVSAAQQRFVSAAVYAGLSLVMLLLPNLSRLPRYTPELHVLLVAPAAAMGAVPSAALLILHTLGRRPMSPEWVAKHTVIVALLLFLSVLSLWGSRRLRAMGLFDATDEPQHHAAAPPNVVP